MKKALLIAIAKFTRKYHIRGMDRILRILYSPEFREHNYISTVIDYDDGAKININTSSFIEWEIFFKGIYEPHIEDYLKRALYSGLIAVDVGANVGIHTIVMAKRVGLTGQVFVFEPNPIIFNRLLENTKLNNFTNIVPLRYALSDKHSSMILHTFRDGLSRQGMAGFYTNVPENECVDVLVDVATFDSLVETLNIKQVDFIKIDTEGNDFKVLRGMQKSIIYFKPEIIFEYLRDQWDYSGHTWEDALEFFANLNYSLYTITNKGVVPILGVVPPDSDNILARPETNPAQKAVLRVDSRPLAR